MSEVEETVRTRLRSLRTTMGYSLGDLAEKTGLNPSTISRVETGKRTLSLDVLKSLAEALQVSLDTLLATDDDDDVVIRPTPSRDGTMTTWLLSRADGRTVALKIRYEPTTEPPVQRIHAGHVWFVVVHGAVRLWLGDRRIDIETGEAAEYSTMTPHAITAIGEPAEVVMTFDHAGQRAHFHH
ncbi:MAG: XRE family transcriptional regulator [Actinomycetota bacterium]